ncbi:MAG: TolC family protein, partial [Planctomycetota bacterium]
MISQPTITQKRRVRAGMRVMANARKRWALCVVLAGGILGSGCAINPSEPVCSERCYTPSTETSTCAPVMAVEEPCLDEACLKPWREFASPLDLTEETITEDNTRNLTLEDAIAIALRNSTVLRDLGGTVLNSPSAITAYIDPALAFTDPRFGQEAALADFDATLTGALQFENNDRAFNNQFVGDAGLFKQDFHNYNWGISKQAATGAVFNFQHVTLYDSNNQLSNRLGSTSWETYLEGQIRQPLLQGAGTEFNRIAGPNAQPGNINGVLIARVRQDLSVADFQRGVRNLVADIENAYWDLYFAYRDLEAKIEVRDKALEVRRAEEAKGNAGQASDAAQAREQYYRFQVDVVDSLNGRPIESTQTNNGSTGGTFR